MQVSMTHVRGRAQIYKAFGLSVKSSKELLNDKASLSHNA